MCKVLNIKNAETSTFSAREEPVGGSPGVEPGCSAADLSELPGRERKTQPGDSAAALVEACTQVKQMLEPIVSLQSKLHVETLALSKESARYRTCSEPPGKLYSCGGQEHNGRYCFVWGGMGVIASCGGSVLVEQYNFWALVGR